MMVLRVIRREFPHALLPVDTFRAEIARQALDEGVVMINDVSAGLLDEAMLATIGRYRAAYVMMHMRGDPQSMTRLTAYENLWVDLVDYFARRIAALRSHGVADTIIDPGFGFAKTLDQNFEILRHLQNLHVFEIPLLVGLSRKAMIWKTIGVTPEAALNGATTLQVAALLQGAHILRVHDVKEAMEAIKLTSFAV